MELPSAGKLYSDDKGSKLEKLLLICTWLVGPAVFGGSRLLPEERHGGKGSVEMSGEWREVDDDDKARFSEKDTIAVFSCMNEIFSTKNFID